MFNFASGIDLGPDFIKNVQAFEAMKKNIPVTGNPGILENPEMLSEAYGISGTSGGLFDPKDSSAIPTLDEYYSKNKYGSLLDDYYKSDMFDSDAYYNVSPIQPTVSIFHKLFGGRGPGQMQQLGNFDDYLKQQYQMVQDTNPLRIKRTPEDLAKRQLITDAYGQMGFDGGPTEGARPGITELPGPGEPPMPMIPGIGGRPPAYGEIYEPGGGQPLLGPDGNPMPIGLPKGPVGGPKIFDSTIGEVPPPGSGQPRGGSGIETLMPEEEGYKKYIASDANPFESMGISSLGQDALRQMIFERNNPQINQERNYKSYIG